MNNLRTRRYPSRIVVAGTVALLLGACGDGGSPTPPSSSNLSAPTHAPSTTNPSGQEQQQAVETAYTQFWPRSLAISNTPENTWQEAMAALAVDPQLSTTVQAMHRNKQVGVKPYGDVTTRISRVDVHGDQATVIDCQDGSRSGQADAATGARKTVGLPHIPIHAHMVRDATDGQWKVSQLDYPGGSC